MAKNEFLTRQAASKVRKQKHFYYYKDWFVFPIAIEFHSNLMEYMPRASRLCIHFLWWHWQWTFVKGVKENEE